MRAKVVQYFYKHKTQLYGSYTSGLEIIFKLDVALTDGLIVLVYLRLAVLKLVNTKPNDKKSRKT